MNKINILSSIVLIFFSFTGYTQVFPLKKDIEITSNYGYRVHPITKKQQFHAGVDIRAYFEPIYNIKDGYLIERGYNPFKGHYMYILHENDIISGYYHLSMVNDKIDIGDYIPENFRIGITGDTGRVTAPHLHFVLKHKNEYINPLIFLNGISNQSN